MHHLMKSYGTVFFIPNDVEDAEVSYMVNSTFVASMRHIKSLDALLCTEQLMCMLFCSLKYNAISLIAA